MPNRIVFENVNFTGQNCEDNSKTIFHCLLKVRAKSDALAGRYPTLNQVLEPIILDDQQNYFTIFADFKLNSDLKVQCDPQTISNNLELKSGQDFNYIYQLSNTGNAPLKNVVAIATMPSIGDKEIMDPNGIARNSSFGISPCILSYELLETKKGVTSVINNSWVSIDYKETDLICDPLFDGVNICTSDGAFSSTCASNYKTIRFITKNGFVLEPFSQLEIRVKYSMPNNILLGSKAYHNFAVKGVSALTNSTLETNIVPSKIASITIASRATCDPVVFDCSECVTSFSPIPGKKYVLSAWVKEEYIDQIPATYEHSGVQLSFNDGAIVIPIARPSGPIIDGWQRIEYVFTIPANASNIGIELVNEMNSAEAYFDDIRIHPFQSNMKSFVYNPSTQKLTAELDENNYATFYEYDDEGILIRVKKETERGIMTIKETRMNQSKIKK